MASSQQKTNSASAYAIKLSHVLVDGQPREFAYTAISFDPVLATASAAT